MPARLRLVAVVGWRRGGGMKGASGLPLPEGGVRGESVDSLFEGVDRIARDPRELYVEGVEREPRVEGDEYECWGDTAAAEADEGEVRRNAKG